MSDDSKALPVTALSRRCDPAAFRFATTAELAEGGTVAGQARAASALEFGMAVAGEGYNVFVMGPAGSGKRTLVQETLTARAKAAPAPSDWVYVNNFAAPHRPAAIELPAGRGAELRADMARLVEELRSAIPAVFESEEYTNRVEQIDAEFNQRHERAISEIGKDAARERIALLRTPSGFTFAPLKDGEVISADDFNQLPDKEKERIAETVAQLQQRLEKTIREVLRWRKERNERVRQLNRDMTMLAVGQHVDELMERHAGVPRVTEYLQAVKADVLENAEDFRRPEHGAMAIPGLAGPGRDAELRRYAVNVLVEHRHEDGAPLVLLDHPTHSRLVGRIEHTQHFGTLVTDFTLIKPGALHRANGGYLVVDAYKILTQPFAWDALKRALTRGEARIEPIGELWGFGTAESLDPDPIPLRVKVVVTGERYVYYLLQAYDPDFRRLFHVVADFEESLDRDRGTEQELAHMIAGAARREKLLPLEPAGVARVIDHASRWAGDSRKVSTEAAAITRLVREADFLARGAGRAAIAGADVDAALEGQRRREDRVKRRLHEAIARGTVLIDTDGAKVGQVNALSVIQLGEFPFAVPTRVTATTRVGDGQVIDIQREVELGGAIHSKGVLTLSQFLAARYSARRPLSLAASLVFEQTYSQVEGDSASLAELCALLSSLSGLPIRQSLALTGSVNQLGEVQAIGGVNEKIEGFFDVCAGRGLSGSQGVVIPASNAEHLMLREDVIAAVAAGKFRVFAVRAVDEAIELLTGVPAGTPDPAGDPQSVNGRVAARLQEYSTLRRGPPAAARVGARRRRTQQDGR
jgi:predicted ATP-dependent protease